MSEELNIGSPQPQETQQIEVTTPEVNTTPTETVTEQPKIKVKYNHEEKELSYDEAITYAQKGMNYDKAIERERQAERDKTISEMYGESHGIHTYADYQKALAEQAEEARKEELRSQGIDPETFNKYVEENPIVKQAAELVKQQNHQKYLAEQVKALETYSPGIDINKLDPRVVEEFRAGKPLVDAYMKYEVEGLKAKLAEYEGKFKAQETNLLNEASSTGSLTGNGSNPSDFITYETFEANKHDQRWVIKNLSKINESRTKW